MLIAIGISYLAPGCVVEAVEFVPAEGCKTLLAGTWRTRYLRQTRLLAWSVLPVVVFRFLPRDDGVVVRELGSIGLDSRLVKWLRSGV